MEPARRGGAVRAAIAAVLLLAGLASLGVWRVASGNEDLPYDSSASPPATARVTSGDTYSLAVPGGVAAMLARGVPSATSTSGDLISLQCTYSTTGTTGSGDALTVSAESTTTKAENTVGHFVAPVSGAISVSCDGWGAMFVPDSDDRPTDSAGWALVIAVLTLTVGGGLAVSGIRLAWERNRPSRPADEDDEIEGFVDVGYAGRHDGEVGGRDRGDGTA